LPGGREIVEQNVKKLTDLAEDLLKRHTKNTLTDLLNSPLVTWLLPFLGPFLFVKEGGHCIRSGFFELARGSVEEGRVSWETMLGW
jgi:hypothetical protein